MEQVLRNKIRKRNEELYLQKVENVRKINKVVNEALVKLFCRYERFCENGFDKVIMEKFHESFKLNQGLKDVDPADVTINEKNVNGEVDDQHKKTNEDKLFD